MAANNIEDTTEGLPLKALTIRKVKHRMVCIDKQMIGEYSTLNNEFVDNDSGLKYLHIPSPLMPLDLLDGFTNGRQYVSERIMNKDFVWCHLLKWILKHRQLSIKNGGFISQRHILSYIMTLPYDTTNSMVLLATKHKGIIYLHYKSCEELNPSSNNQQNSFCGHRFEQYMTSGDPNTDHTAVVSARLEHNNKSNRIYHSVMYTFGTDCIGSQMRPRWLRLQDFVDLKTTNPGTVDKPYRRLKWWADTYLKGVSTIYYGEKDHNYVVTDVKEIKVDTLPNDMFWSPDVCINFLNKFLSYMKEVVTIDDPNIVYQFECHPSQDITYTIDSATDDLRVLPEWFTNKI